MIQKCVTVLCSLLFAFTAAAAPTCPEYMPVPFTKIETDIDLGDGDILRGEKITCKKIGIAADMIADLRKMLSPELATPARLVFRMVDTFDNAFFDPSDVSLNIPYQLVLDGYGKHPSKTIPVWAHEYGHAILDHNLAEIAPQWISQIRKRATKSAPASVDVLDAIMRPYHEFFADVVAVLYLEDASAVADALYFTGLIANPEGRPSACPNTEKNCRPKNSTVDLRLMSIGRDFADRSNQLGRWKGVEADDHHNLLAPARYHVWKYYLANPEIYREKSKMSGIIVDAIIGDVSRRLKRMANSNGEITRESFNKEMGDVFRANAEFIKTLDRYFEKGFDLERR